MCWGSGRFDFAKCSIRIWEDASFRKYIVLRNTHFAKSDSCVSERVDLQRYSVAWKVGLPPFFVVSVTHSVLVLGDDIIPSRYMLFVHINEKML